MTNMLLFFTVELGPGAAVDVLRTPAMDFDPSGPAQPGSGVFGLPHGEDDAQVVLLPVPWEATTSYGGGASDGPRCIFQASQQVDLFDLDVDKPYTAGIHMLPDPEGIVAWNGQAKALAQRVIEAGGAEGNPDLEAALARVNELSVQVNAWVEHETSRLLAKKKIVGVVGGDHSVPFGALKALAASRKNALVKPFGVLHFDAHSDTRKAYEGFAHSHASIMWNVLEAIPLVSKLVQVGIRDVCEDEIAYTRSLGERVRIFFDRDIAMKRLAGEPFLAVVREIVDALPEEIWVSFDVDGLDPRYCPHTGTPVPGGLDFHEAIAVLREVVRAKRKIVGFDLNEVAPNPRDEDDQWDGNVGARLLYKLCGFTLASQGKAKLS
jgi:agmatinase